MRTIDNSQDVLDSRDIIARIEELEDDRDNFIADNEEMEMPPSWEDENQEDAEELKNLTTLQDELGGYCEDWKYGTTLIREDYFEEYVQDMLEDIGELPKDLPSYIVIDWDKTAYNVRQDYTSGEFDGITYWAR